MFLKGQKPVMCSVCCLFLDAILLTPHSSLDLVGEETEAGELITCPELCSSGGTMNSLSMRHISCSFPSDTGVSLRVAVFCLWTLSFCWWVCSPMRSSPSCLACKDIDFSQKHSICGEIFRLPDAVSHPPWGCPDERQELPQIETECICGFEEKSLETRWLSKVASILFT